MRAGLFRSEAISLMLALGANTAFAADVSRDSFGELSDGRKVEAITLTNARGTAARIITLGATLQGLEFTDSKGEKADVVLGYSDIEGYLAAPNYFGVTVGRYANRIAGGSFSLDGKTYSLAQNNGPNALHGGEKGFDKVLWKVVSTKKSPASSVTLSYVSPDGQEGYPGTLKVTATYTLNDADELRIDYRATTDKPTIVNLTNHAFFNLAGAEANESILDHELVIAADAYTPVSKALIPTGEIREVAGTPFDFREPTVIGARIRDGSDEQLIYGQGYDHNYVLNGGASEEPKLAARVEDPGSGRALELLTNQPGVQFYSGNFLDGSIAGKGGRVYRQSDGLCLEPQLFPDTPNQPAFGSARLNPGETYHNIMVFRLSADAR